MTDLPDIFKLRKANDRINEAKTQPAPKMLFGEFWLESELCILFADTGKGKSILAVQIAESIARGEAIEPMTLTAPAQKVLYFDFELSAKQFEMRYSADPDEGEEFFKDHYQFSDNFYSVEIDADGECPTDFTTFEEYLRVSVEKMIRATGAKVVIIDNLTYLRGANDTAREAIPLMRELRRLKKELGLSILVLAHTPKRDMARRITVNDLQGSKVLSNFADNVFAIGQSSIESAFRYVKHIKPRSTEMLYDSENVLVGEIRKWEKNFLAFRFYKFSKEADHLTKEINQIVLDRAEIVREMSEEKGMSQRQIAAELGVSPGTVNRYLQMTKAEDDYYGLDDNFRGNDVEDADPRVKKETADEGGREEPKYCKHDPYGYNREYVPDFLRVHGETCPGDDFDEEWYDREGNEEGEEAEDEPEYKPEEEPPQPVKEYKTMEDKIEVGDIVLCADGRLKRRTNWGWDASVEGVESG